MKTREPATLSLLAWKSLAWAVPGAALAILALPSPAATRIDTTITITNTPDNSNYITFNLQTRYWTTNLTNSSLQIRCTNNPPNSATNLYSHLNASPFLGQNSVGWLSPTQLVIYGMGWTNYTASTGPWVELGGASNWAYITFKTNLATTTPPVTVPYTTNEVTAFRNWQMSCLLSNVGEFATNAAKIGSTFTSTLVQTNGNQIIYGTKSIRTLVVSNLFSDTDGNITYWDMSDSSGAVRTYFRMPDSLDDPQIVMKFYSDGTAGYISVNTNFHLLLPTGGAASDVLVLSNAATGEAIWQSVRYVTNSGGVATNLTFYETNSFRSPLGWIQVYMQDLAYGGLYFTNSASAEFAHILGTFDGTRLMDQNTFTNYTTNVVNAMAASHQIKLANTTTTNATLLGSNTVNGNLSLVSANVTTLVDGSPNNLNIPTNAVAILSGPGAVWTLDGVYPVWAGRFHLLRNGSGYSVRVVNQSGSASDATYRILTENGSDTTLAAGAWFGLWYDGGASRWRLISISQPSGFQDLTVSNLIATNLLTTIGTASTQPVGCFGSLMMTGTNILTCAGATDVYTNIGGYNVIATNRFIGETNTGTLTNQVAGFYRVTINLSFMGQNSKTYESDLFTNGVACDAVSWKATFDNPARIRTHTAAGIVYLPANCQITQAIQCNDGTGGTIAIHRASLVLGTP